MTEENNEQPKKTGKGKKILIAILLLAVAGGGVFAYLLSTQKSAEHYIATGRVSSIANGVSMFVTMNGRLMTQEEFSKDLRAQNIELDPWGHPYIYENPSSNKYGYDVICYGADGKPGGTGNDEDIRFSENYKPVTSP
jgi:general secretion pathway protein G